MLQSVMDNLKSFIGADENLQNVNTLSFGDAHLNQSPSAEDILFCNFDEKALHE